MLAVILVALALATPSWAQSCVPTVSTAQVPSTIEEVISSVDVYYPSLTSIGAAISVIELSSPTVALAESTLEYYASSYATVIDEIESIYSYPSLYTDLSYVSELTSAYSSIASAVSYIESVEETQTELAAYQSTLQSVEVSYSSILTELSIETDIAYPTLYIASQVISEATLTDSSIFASVVAVYTAISDSPTVESAVSYLSYAAYTVPSTVVSEILTIIYSPSTVSASVVSSLESCYSTVYDELVFVTGFTYQYPSVVTDLVDYLSAASYVSSLGSAVYTVLTQQMSTFTYEVDVLSGASSVVPTVIADLSVLSYIEAESPSIAYAESTIEGSFYFSPTVASAIYYALDYPSLIPYPTQVAYEEESHESLVSAIDYIISWEDYYSSSLTLLTGVESGLISAFTEYRTLLTAFSYVQDVTEPSEASASASFSSAKDLVSDLTYVLSGVSYVVSELPSLSCAESEVEYYAEEYPSVASYIWGVLDDDVYVSASSAPYFASLIASYSSVYYYEQQILGGLIDYSFLASLESSFISAAATDSSLITQYESLGSIEYSASSYLDSIESSYSSSSSSY
jgi:hypothetical protein